jgi:hypothetical protein
LTSHDAKAALASVNKAKIVRGGFQSALSPSTVELRDHMRDGRPQQPDFLIKGSGVAAAAPLNIWMSRPHAPRDHQTFCVSCHTALPYALARPTLRAVLGELTPSPIERRLLDNVITRVRLWEEVEPYYVGGSLTILLENSRREA